ncbi:MAG: winged helix-turn-helix transcriptional regulator [Candidatus Thorarchaeota archaeon]
MDLLDKLIILDLLQNCRQSYQSIARKNGVTLNAIKTRIRKYLDDGIIEFSLEPHLANIDGEWAMALVSTEGTEDIEEFITHLGNNDMINEVGPLSGGSYIIFAVYTGREGLAKLAKFLRTTDHVKDVEIHQVFIEKGAKVEFSKSELKILRCLFDDPRMQLGRIAECAGYSAKTVRRILEKIVESNGIWFTLRLRLNAGGGLIFLARIEWDERKTELQEILDWLNNSFPVSYWIPLISVSEPVMFCAFVVDYVKDINPIIEHIKTTHFVRSVVPIMGTESYSFPDLRRQWLQNKFLTLDK